MGWTNTLKLFLYKRTRQLQLYEEGVSLQTNNVSKQFNMGSLSMFELFLQEKKNIAVPKKSDSFCTFCLALPLFICELCSALITKTLERDQHKPASEAEAGTSPTFACLPFLFDYSPGIIFCSDNFCLHVFDWR